MALKESDYLWLKFPSVMNAGLKIALSFLLCFLYTYFTVSQPLSPISPSQNFITSDSSVLFSWNSQNGAVFYEIEIATTPTYSLIHTFHSNIPGTSVSLVLPPDQTYFWHIRAFDGQLMSDWSSSRKLTVFSPDDIPGLKLWYRTDLIDTTNGSMVKFLPDYSPFGNHASQNTDNKAPLVLNQALQGKPVIRFDGINDNLVANFLHTNDEITTFILQRIHSSNSYPDGSLSLYNTIYNNDYSNYQSLICSWIYGAPGSLDAFRSTTCSYTNSFNNKWNLYSIKVGNSYLRTYVNGLFSHQTATQQAFNTAKAVIGSRYNNATFQDFMGFDLAEILFFNNALPDSVINLLTTALLNKYAPPLVLPADSSTGFCSCQINAPGGYRHYQWSTGDTTSHITASTSGCYILTVTDIFDRTSSDSILISIDSIAFNVFTTLMICADSSITVSTNQPSQLLFEWSTGAQAPSITLSEAGSYWLTVTDLNGCSSVSDTIHLDIDHFASIASLDTSSPYCLGSDLCLASGASSASSYLWMDGSNQPCITINNSGLYYVTITDTVGCIATDSVFVTAAHETPHAAFHFINECLGDSVPFYNMTICPDSLVEWIWNFGDGSGSNLKNPVHLYNDTGVFHISLKAYSEFGCVDQKDSVIQILPNPTCHFEADTGCVNIEIMFTDQSFVPDQDSIVTWLWNFGDGNFSPLQNPIHQYAVSGIFIIRLAIETLHGCQDAFEKTILVVDSLPKPEQIQLINPSDGFFSEDTSIQFSWQSVQNAVWYSLQISTDSTFNTLSLISLATQYNVATLQLGSGQVYFWRVIAYNLCRDSVISDCFRVTTFSPLDISGLKLWLSANNANAGMDDKVDVWQDRTLLHNDAFQADINKQPLLLDSLLNNKPVIRFDGLNDCLSGAIEHNNNTISVFFVQKVNEVIFNDGSLSLYNTSIPNDWDNFSSLVCSYLRSTTNSLDCYRNNSYILNTSTYQKWALYSLLVKVDSIKTYLNGTLIQTLGTQGNFNISRYVIGSRWINSVFQQFMSFDIAEILIFENALHDTLRQKTEQFLLSKYQPPPVRLEPDFVELRHFCPVVIDADSRYSTYLWSTGDTTQSIEIHKHGWIALTVTDPFGVSSSDSIYIRYPNTPLRDTAICYGDTITLSARVRQPYLHQWSSLSNGSISSDTTLKVWQAGTYWLTLTDSSGCTLTDTVIIQVDSFPLLTSLGPDTALRCQGEKLVLAAGGPEAVQYLWHDGSTLAEMPIQAPGTYSVTVHNALGCRAVDSVWVALKGILPLAEFNLTDSVCLGESMQFFDLSQPDPQDTSASIIIWYWDFGDGNTSDQQHPLHLFQSPCIHLVKLRVETDAGCSRETEKTVFVYPLPRAAFLTASGCTGIAVPFDDHSYYPIDEGVAWEWNFGDPASGNLNFSSLKAPLHSYLNPGIYQVGLIVTTAAGCHDTVQQEVEIFEAPGADFTHTQACEGQPIQFTDISELPPWHPVIGWEWDFGDGSPVSSQQHPVHTYAQWGSYPVTMTMKTFRCTVKKVMPVNADPRPLAAFQATDWCVSAPYHFTDQSSISLGSITQWQWDFGVLGTDSLQHPVLVFPASGHYPLSLTVVSDKGCHSDPLGYEIEVFAPPLAAIEAFVNEWNTQYHVTFSSQSSQDVIIWQWHFGDGSTSPLENPFHAYADSGLYQVMLIVTNVHGCSDTAQLTLHLLSPRSDLVLSGIVHESTGGQFRFAADLYNAGTRYIGEVALQVSINGVPSLAENWTGSMPPDSGFRYLFKGGIPLRPGWSPYYYCITAENTDGLPDGDPRNNLQCEAINTVFTFPDPYPNPAFDLLYIDLVLEDEADVVFSVINALGQLLLSPSRHHGEKGLNRFSLPVESLPSGMYSLRVMIGGHHYLKRFTRL